MRYSATHSACACAWSLGMSHGTVFSCVDGLVAVVPIEPTECGWCLLLGIPYGSVLARFVCDATNASITVLEER